MNFAVTSTRTGGVGRSLSGIVLGRPWTLEILLPDWDLAQADHLQAGGNLHGGLLLVRVNPAFSEQWSLSHLYSVLHNPGQRDTGAQAR
jgi:hypothetical protein